jgi:predicted Zn-dependent protease
MVFGDFSGGSAALIVAEQLLNASYTREAEAAADRYALRMMETAKVDAGAMAGFFDKLSDLERMTPEMPVYLSSHPKSTSRAEAARAFAKDQGRTRPILSDYDWTALRNICKDRKADEDS